MNLCASALFNKSSHVVYLTEYPCFSVSHTMKSIRLPYSTKLPRDKTLTVRSPCEYSWKNFPIYIKTASTSAKTL